MQAMKWIAILSMASALCACDTKKDVSAPEGKKSDGKVEASDTSAKTEGAASYNAEMFELAAKSNCLACHAIEKKVVGPSLKDVAVKYRGDAGAEDKLIAKISRGSSGVWGSVPMPANSPAVSDADIRALVKFTLSLQ